MKKLFLHTTLLSASIFLLINCKQPATTPILGNWVSKAQFAGLSRQGASSWVIGDTGYLVGGYNSEHDSCLSDLWQFDPVKGMWAQKAYFPGGARLLAVAFAIGNNGYLATGTTITGQKFQDCWQYNPSTNVWTKMANLPDANISGSGARYDAVTFAIGNNGYVGTGIGVNGVCLDDFWKFDPSTNSWTSISNAPAKRSGAIAFTTFNDTAAYVVTGTNEGGVELTDFWKYSPSAGWIKLRDITNSDQTDSYDDNYTDIIRDHAVALVLPDNGVWKAYITTGKNSVLNDKTWEYDFATDIWVRKAPFTEGGEVRGARQQAIAWSFINLKRGFVGTGRSSTIITNNIGTGTSSLSDIAEWYPASTENTAD